MKLIRKSRTELRVQGTEASTPKPTTEHPQNTEKTRGDAEANDPNNSCASSTLTTHAYRAADPTRPSSTRHVHPSRKLASVFQAPEAAVAQGHYRRRSVVFLRGLIAAALVLRMLLVVVVGSAAVFTFTFTIIGHKRRRRRLLRPRGQVVGIPCRLYVEILRVAGATSHTWYVCIHTSTKYTRLLSVHKAKNTRSCKDEDAAKLGRNKRHKRGTPVRLTAR